MLAVQLPQSFGFLLFLPFLASGLYAFYCFDSLVRYQYQHHFKEWEKDGKPIGFFLGSTRCINVPRKTCQKLCAVCVTYLP